MHLRQQSFRERNAGQNPVSYTHLLLDYFYKRADKSVLDKNLLNEYNPVNNVPDDFLFAVKEMYENVSECGFDVQK